jgi:NADH-quinone oxidoreductase subunit J
MVTAVMVVSNRDLVRAVLWFGLTLVLTAVAYAQLAADMLAAIQVMLYAGGVVTLVLFAVMLTPRPDDERPTLEFVKPERGIGAALVMFFVIAMALMQTDLPNGPVVVSNSQEVGRLILTDHLLAFETLSVLLLAAMIGAIVIARRRDAP